MSETEKAIVRLIFDWLDNSFAHDGGRTDFAIEDSISDVECNQILDVITGGVHLEIV